jgi:hypothetical protein
MRDEERKLVKRFEKAGVVTEIYRQGGGQYVVVQYPACAGIPSWDSTPDIPAAILDGLNQAHIWIESQMNVQLQ